MRVPIYQLDAFSPALFKGNPAAVVVLDTQLSDTVLQAIAAENNLSETAFLYRQEGAYQLRWFTPVQEVPLCGHATMASAAVVLQRLEPGRDKVLFQTLSGPLTVTYAQDRYTLDFPARAIQSCALSASVSKALGLAPHALYVNEHAYLAVYDTACQVRQLQPDMLQLKALDRAGVIVTALSDTANYDFISRYFAPAKGVSEDPVTGTAHCALVPYWAKRLDKTELQAYQASARGGELSCTLKGERVTLSGTCRFYLEGHITVI